MCYFITFAVPKKLKNSEKSRELLVLEFGPVIGGHEYGSDLFAYSVTFGGYSCNLATLAGWVEEIENERQESLTKREGPYSLRSAELDAGLRLGLAKRRPGSSFRCIDG